MPLFDDEPTELPAPVEAIEAPTAVQEVPVPDTASVYETEPKQIVGEITYEGDPWVGVYYSQLLATDDTPQRLDLNLSPTLQQYVRIEDYVVLTTSSLSASTDENQLTELTAEAIMYPGLEPNRGDHFVARMSDNRWGLFVITEFTRTGYYDMRTHEITISFVDYMSDEYQHNLDMKTAQTLYFDRENPMSPGSQVKKRTERYDAATKLGEVVNWWYDEFYDLQTRTAILEKDADQHYDPSLVEFFRKIIPEAIYSKLPKLEVYEVPSTEYKKAFSSVWDVLIDNEETHLRRVDRHVASVSKTAFRSRFVYSAIGYSQVEKVLVPASQPTLYGYALIETGDETPEQDTYVFSPEFYDGKDSDMRPIEKMVLGVLNRQPTTMEKVAAEIEALYNATTETRFYRIPVLIWVLVQMV